MISRVIPIASKRTQQCRTSHIPLLKDHDSAMSEKCNVQSMVYIITKERIYPCRGIFLFGKPGNFDILLTTLAAVFADVHDSVVLSKQARSHVVSQFVQKFVSR